MYKQFYIYIMTNKHNTVLHIGVTNDLKKMVYEHKEKLVDGFTKKYNLNKLVYYEIFDSSCSAATREKQIRSHSRQKKMNLIRTLNPEWDDLYDYF